MKKRYSIILAVSLFLLISFDQASIKPNIKTSTMHYFEASPHIVKHGQSTSLNLFVGNFKKWKWSKVSPRYIVVDDYMGVSLPGREWYYSRIGTDRGKMGSGNFKINLGGGTAYAEVRNGWAGIWTILMHNASDNDTLSPANLLGPYVKKKFQPQIIGLQINLSDGYGYFKIELKDTKGQTLQSEKRKLTGGSRTLNFSMRPQVDIKELNWIVDGNGFAKVKNVHLKIKSPKYSIPEAVFLFSFGHLSQCYDPKKGLVRDRARWPSKDFSSIPTTGLFALATAIAHDLGYVEEEAAKKVVRRIKNVLRNLPRYHGLLPHFVAKKKIALDTEWSSLDTVLALTSAILACQSFGLNSSRLEEMIRNIDWHDLTDGGTQSISHGYHYDGKKSKAHGILLDQRHSLELSPSPLPLGGKLPDWTLTANLRPGMDQALMMN